jgi:hypothetical protein
MMPLSVSHTSGGDHEDRLGILKCERFLPCPPTSITCAGTYGNSSLLKTRRYRSPTVITLLHSSSGRSMLKVSSVRRTISTVSRPIDVVLALRISIIYCRGRVVGDSDITPFSIYFRICGDPPASNAFLKGHDFSRAASPSNATELQPLREVSTIVFRRDRFSRVS